jgi:hypothetical protein
MPLLPPVMTATFPSSFAIGIPPQNSRLQPTAEL